MKNEIKSLKYNEIIDRFKTGFIDLRVPGVNDDYSKEFSITFTDYGRILKVLVSCAKVIEISYVEQPSDYIDFSLDSLTMEELMSQRLLLHKAFTGGRATINGNIFYGIKLAERLQALIDLNPLPLPVSESNSEKELSYDHNEELIDVKIDGNRSISVRVGYREDTDCSEILFIFPPDPLMGGNSENNVVQAVFNKAVTEGVLAASFNYRGVETGSLYDDKMFAYWEEMQKTGNYSSITGDIKLIIEKILKEFNSDARVFFAGYSFGSYMGLLTGTEIRKQKGTIPYKTVCISPPIKEYPFYEFLSKEGLSVITTNRDEFCPLELLKAESQKYKFNIEVVDSEDHFYRGMEKQLADKVMEKII